MFLRKCAAALIAFAVLNACPALHAQDFAFPPALTGEIPVSEPTFGAAPQKQHTPMTASNGDISLAIWLDERIVGSVGFGRLYGARLDRDGNLLDPLNIDLDEYASPSGLFWNGQHFVLIASRDDGVFRITRVDSDGHVVSRERLDLGDTDWRVRATLSGVNAHVVFVGFEGERKVRLFDGNLRPLTAEITLPDLPGGQSEPSGGVVKTALLRDGEFLVVRGLAGQARCGTILCDRMFTTRFDSAGRIVSTDESLAPKMDLRSILGGGDDGYLVLNQDSVTAAVRTFRLNRSGVWSGGTTVLYPGDQHGPIERPLPSLIFDGERFVAAWVVSSTGGMSQIHSAELEEDGVLVRSSSLTPPIPFTNHLVVGDNGGHRTVIAGSWPPNTGSLLDLYAHTFSSGDQRTVHSILLSVSANTQIEAVTAASDRGYAVVWREVPLNDLLIRRFAADGHPIGEPSVVTSSAETFGLVSSGETFLAVWQDERNLKGRRMSSSGEWLDPEGFVIETSSTQFASDLSFDRRSLASNGTGFLVAWIAREMDSKVFVRSIPASGLPSSERAPIAEGIGQYTPAIASNGSEYFVVWSDGFRECQITCPPYEFFRIRGIRVGSDGKALDASPVVLDRDHGYPVGPSIIWDGARYLVTYFRDGIRAVRLAGDGTVVETGVDGEGVIIRSAQESTVAQLVPARDGAVLLLERGSAGDVRDVVTVIEGIVIRSDRPLSEAAAVPPFTIVPEGIPGFRGFSITGASRGGQLLVAYSRIHDEETYGGVRRVWVRLFGKPEPPRRRAVRR